MADRDNDRVEVFDTATNAVVGQFGDATTIDDPFGVAVDQATGDVYVSSTASNTITKWSDSGLGYVRDVLFVSPAPVADPAVAGQLGSFAVPLAVAAGSGDLLVADPGTQVVDVYDSAGVFQSSFNGDGSPGAQAFSGLKDIATDPAGGDIYVVDGGRVLRFDQAGGYEATLDPVAGPALVGVDPTTSDPVVTVNADDPCSTNRVIAYAGTVIDSASAVPPATGDCTAVSGVAFTATGGLYAVNGGAFGGCCGGQTSIEELLRSTLAFSATTSAATNVAETTARLRGSLTPGATEVTYTFEYSTDHTNWTPVGDQGPFDDAGPIAVQANVTGLSDDTGYQYRVAVKATASQGVTAYSNVSSLTTVDGNPPTVVLDPATDIAPDAATLHGHISPQGLATSYHFEYSPNNGTSWNPLPGPDNDPAIDDPIGHGSSDVAVTEALSGLDPHRSYPIRLIATNAIGSTQADDTLMTASVAPEVDTAAATAVTSQAATLHGTVNPHNSATSYHFEYGADTSYGTSTADVDQGANSAVNAVTATLTGLEPSSEYHYKLVADNGTGGSISGPDQTFTTRDMPPVPVTGAATEIGSTSAILHGTVDLHGHPGSFRFSVTQTDGGHRQTTTDTDVPAGTGSVAVSAPVTGLPPDGHYDVQLSATTSGGDRGGNITSFATAALAPYLPPPALPQDNGSVTGCADPGCGTPTTTVVTSPPPPKITSTAKVNGTTATLRVTVPGAGKLTITGSRLTQAHQTVTKNGTITIKVKLTAAGRKALAKAKSRRLAVKATIRFTPTAGTAQATTRTLTFKRKAGR